MFIFATMAYVCGTGKSLYDTKDKSKGPNSQNPPVLHQK